MVYSVYTNIGNIIQLTVKKCANMIKVDLFLRREIFIQFINLKVPRRLKLWFSSILKEFDVYKKKTLTKSGEKIH